MEAIRTWRSDRSKNVMSLGVAVLNLTSHGVPRAYERLMAGESLETKLATFRLAKDGGGWADNPTTQKRRPANA